MCVCVCVSTRTHVCVCVCASVCTHCTFVIKCKAVTKEWIQFKPLGPELGDETFWRENTGRQTNRLKCHVNTWRWAYFQKVTKFSCSMKTSKALTFCLELSINQSSTITAEYRRDLGAITNIASYYILCLSHPTKAAVSHIQTATLWKMTIRVYVGLFSSKWSQFCGFWRSITQNNIGGEGAYCSLGLFNTKMAPKLFVKPTFFTVIYTF